MVDQEGFWLVVAVSLLVEVGEELVVEEQEAQLVVV